MGVIIRGMFRLEKQFTFEASHRLPFHDGKCARLHGHSWKVTLVVCGDELEDDGPKRSMLIDYSDISKVMKPLLDEKLDHHHLNHSLPEIMNPTSEEIARWIYRQIKPVFPVLAEVIVDETCTSRCIYTEN